MFARSAQHAAVLLLIAAFAPAAGWADIVYEFDQGKLNGHVHGGASSAPFTDTENPLITHTLTTETVLDSAGNAGTATTVEDLDIFGILTTGDQLDQSRGFNNSELWGFSWDVATRLTSVSFETEGGNFAIGNTEWTSDARTFNTAGIPGLSYDTSTRQFLFNIDNTDTSNGTFDLAAVEDMSSDTMEVGSGSSYTFTASFGTVSVDAFAFATPPPPPTAVPEPGSVLALLGVAGLAVGRRFHRKRKQPVAASEE